MAKFVRVAFTKVDGIRETIHINPDMIAMVCVERLGTKHAVQLRWGMMDSGVLVGVYATRKQAADRMSRLMKAFRAAV
jgi:hypothetical protein